MIKGSSMILLCGKICCPTESSTMSENKSASNNVESYIRANQTRLRFNEPRQVVVALFQCTMYAILFEFLLVKKARHLSQCNTKLKAHHKNDGFFALAALPLEAAFIDRTGRRSREDFYPRLFETVTECQISIDNFRTVLK